MGGPPNILTSWDAIVRAADLPGPCTLIGGMENKMEATILENQMEERMENEMDTGIIY